MKKWQVLIALCMAFVAGPLHADIDSFTDSVKEAERTPKKDTETTESTVSNDGDNTLGHVFGELVFTVLGYIWYYDNVYIHYGDRPYDDGVFIRRPTPAVQGEGSIGAAHIYPHTAKYYWFSASASGFWLNDIGVGSWVSFSGNAYKFIGPYADFYVATDGETWLRGTRVGAHFSLVQFNPFQMSLYVQWILWDGAITRNGVNAGLELRFYPVKPVTFRFKFGGQNFAAFTLGETEAEFGFMLKSWEIFAGYRAWYLEDAIWGGPYLGVRRYF
jgi:hypothetical protein